MGSISVLIVRYAHLARAAAVFLLTGTFAGCTSYLIEREGKPWPGHYDDCPVMYRMTRLEVASLSWALSGDLKPSDACLAHYYPKAARDATYKTANQWLTPLYLLSFPIDASVDTVILPFTAPAAIFSD